LRILKLGYGRNKPGAVVCPERIVKKMDRKAKDFLLVPLTWTGPWGGEFCEAGVESVFCRTDEPEKIRQSCRLHGRKNPQDFRNGSGLRVFGLDFF
jgi:hypothetical protein